MDSKTQLILEREIYDFIVVNLLHLMYPFTCTCMCVCLIWGRGEEGSLSYARHYCRLYSLFLCHVCNLLIYVAIVETTIVRELLILLRTKVF